MGKFKICIGEILLIITTIIWGSTFIITNTVTQVVPPMFYQGMRYLFGFIGFLPFIGRIRKFTKKQFKIAIIAGSLCWASVALQTYGIKWTTATKSGFITGLNVIMVPIFVAILYHKRIQFKIWISTILALIGVSILSFAGMESLSIGDLFVFVCDIFYALYIIYLDNHLAEIDTIGISAVIVFIISLFSFILAFITGEIPIVFGDQISAIFTTNHLLILIYMGVIATTIATLTQTFGQTTVNSTRAAIIYALEPLFAAFFAVILGSEKLNWQILVGGSLIFVGILFSIEKEKTLSQNISTLQIKHE